VSISFISDSVVYLVSLTQHSLEETSLNFSTNQFD